MTNPAPPTCPTCKHPLAAPLSELVPLPEVQARLHIGRDVCHRMIRSSLIPGGLASGHKLIVVRGPFEAWISGIPAPVAAQAETPVFLHRLLIGERKAG